MKKLLILLFIFVLLIPVLDLLHPGLPITHDGQDHVARIANFYQNLGEGNIVPRWAENLNWGYGHPILMFLYPLPSYVASLTHFLNFSFVDSLKIIFAVSFILSGFFMYLWTKNFMSKEAAVVSAALYVLAPYRFIDFYVRGALGEHVAFLFVPLVLFFLLKLSSKYSKWTIFGGALSLAGLILSHNAISLMFIPLIILYALYLNYSSKQKAFLKNFLLIFFLGFGLSAFFWAPAFFEGKYTLRDIVTAGDYKTRFVQLSSLFYGNWNYGGTGQFSVQLGIVHWLFCFLSIPTTFLLYKAKNRLWILSLSSIIILVLSIFLMLPWSSFIWDRIKLLQNFQFPWRILSVTVFITALLGGIVVSQIKKYNLYVALIVLSMLLLLNQGYWKAQGYKVYLESFFTGIYNSTTDTGESSPIWSVRFMEHRPKAHLEIVDGKAGIAELSRSSTIHEYSLKVETKTRFRENTLYFPGWHVLLDGKEVPIEFQDRLNRGLITFYVPVGDHNLIVKFEETRLRLVSDGVSILSLIFLLVLLRFKKI